MTTLLKSAVRSLGASLGGITAAGSPNSLDCLVLLALVFALPSHCVAQSSTERCASLGQHFVDAMKEAQKDDSFDDVQFLGNDSEEWLHRRKEPPSEDDSFEQWYKQWRSKWQDVITSGREYLGNCPNGTIKTTSVLSAIAHGLRHQGQQQDEIPILNKCIGIDPDYSLCWFELGQAETGLCQFREAQDAFRKVVTIGGFTTQNALLVDNAKYILGYLEVPRAVRLLRERWVCSTSPIQPPLAGSRSNERFGSGFFVTKLGQILTNDHVVEGCERLATSDGKPLTVIDRDAKVDLALLKADATPDAVATFRGGQPPKPGDQVVAFGFPLPDILASEGNVSTGVLSATAGLQNDIRFVQISAPVQPGNSGGPLLDASGHVIGVVVAKLDALRIARLTGDVPQNVNFAVHWATVRAFLDEKGVDYRQAPSSSPSETHSIAAQAKLFSVGIVCTE